MTSGARRPRPVRLKLEGAPDAEPEDPLLLLNERVLCVRVDGVDEAERHVDHGHLDAHLQPKAGSVVADFRKKALREARHRVRLRLATQEDGLDAEGQRRDRVERADARERPQLLLCNQAVALDEQAAVRLGEGELRVPAPDQPVQAPGRVQERLVGQELGREGLVAARREVEGRADVGEGRQRHGAEDRDAVLEVTQELRVAAQEAELAVDLHRVRPGGAGERANRDELLPQRVGERAHGDHVARRRARDRDVLRRDEHVQGGDGRDGADVVAADGELVAEEEALVDGHPVDEGERTPLRLGDLRGDAPAADVAGDDAEAEDLGLLRALAAHGAEARERERRLDGAHVAEESRHRERERDLTPLGRVDGAVARVVDERGRDAARRDVGLREDLGDEGVRVVLLVDRRLRDGGAREGVGEADARGARDFDEAAAARPPELGERRGRVDAPARRLLREEVLLARGQEARDVAEGAADGLLVLREERALAEELLRLGVEREADRDGAVLDVGLGEREEDRLLPVAEGELEREALAAAEQVVRRVVEPEERAADAGDAAVERDLVAAALRDAQVDVDLALLLVGPQLRVLLLVDGVEEAELVELEDRELPQLPVEDVALVDRHLAAQDVVAREGVAEELQAAQRELLALVDGDGEVGDALLGLLRVGLELGRDVGLVLDEARAAVEVLQVLVDRLADALAVGDLAGAQPDDLPDQLLRVDRVALDLDLAEAVELALRDGDGDAQALVRGRDDRERQDGEARPLRPQPLDPRLARARYEVALRAHVIDDVLAQVVVELLQVQNVLPAEARHEAGLLDELHRAAQLAVGEVLVALELDVHDADAVALVHVEGERDGGLRDLLADGLDDGVRVAVLREQFLDDAAGVVDLDRVVGRLLGDADSLLAELLEHVGLADALEALEGQLADDGQLDDLEDDDLAAARAVGGGDADLGLVEEGQVEERLVVALNLRLVVDVP